MSLGMENNCEFVWLFRRIRLSLQTSYINKNLKEDHNKKGMNYEGIEMPKVRCRVHC